ncbi:MAG: InlB B-repeat-containing protein [Dehalococcoidales bacterium]|nr:MAG: InlB B-repeat-containing protein [Dehalococcoidales bacterium]
MAIDQSEPSSYPETIVFASGSSVTLKAVPAPGYRFVSWDGDLDGNTNPGTITMTCNTNVTAIFEPAEKVVTIEVEGSGTTVPVMGSHNIATGTTVTLTATSASGWKFDGWTGNVAEPDRETTTLLVDADITVTANFTELRINWWLFTGILILVFVALSLTSYIVLRKENS